MVLDDITHYYTLREPRDLTQTIFLFGRQFAYTTARAYAGDLHIHTFMFHGHIFSLSPSGLPTTMAGSILHSLDVDQLKLKHVFV